MNRNDSRPVLKTSGVGDNLAEFNYAEFSADTITLATIAPPNRLSYGMKRRLTPK
jgi:hypothetical protein